MKRLTSLLLAGIILLFSCFANVADVLNGDTVTLDGTVQKVSLKGDLTTRQMMSSFGYIPVTVLVNGAGGCKVSNQSTMTNSSTIAQGVRVTISIIPGKQDLYVSGTISQTVTITY